MDENMVLKAYKINNKNKKLQEKCILDQPLLAKNMWSK